MFDLPFESYLETTTLNCSKFAGNLLTTGTVIKNEILHPSVKCLQYFLFYYLENFKSSKKSKYPLYLVVESENNNDLNFNLIIMIHTQYFRNFFFSLKICCSKNKKNALQTRLNKSSLIVDRSTCVYLGLRGFIV